MRRVPKSTRHPLKQIGRISNGSGNELITLFNRDGSISAPSGSLSVRINQVDECENESSIFWGSEVLNPPGGSNSFALRSSVKVSARLQGGNDSEAAASSSFFQTSGNSFLRARKTATLHKPNLDFAGADISGNLPDIRRSKTIST
jgi:hypothetical protein